ncbi:MAG: DUF5717 family protein [Lachnospiraceae bacterium]
MILDLEFAENPMLLSLSAYCFEKEKYNDKLLRYLLLYYEGRLRIRCRYGKRRAVLNSIL